MSCTTYRGKKNLLFIILLLLVLFAAQSGTTK